MSHSSLLMREVDRLARDAKWSNKELAGRLGVDPTMLMHIRAGRNLFSAELLGRIAQVFPLPAVDELIVHHLRVERAARNAMKLAVPADALATFHADTKRALRGFVLHFARESVETGRGLYLWSADAGRLSAAAQFVTHALQEQGIVVERLASNAAVSGSLGRAAIAAALLVVERAEFVNAVVTDLVVRRSDVVKPMVVTSTREITKVDPYLARIFTSMLRPVSLDPIPQPSPSTHAG